MNEEWRQEHYRSFKAVTLEYVCLGPDWDDCGWVVTEPSEVFRGMFAEHLFTAGTHCIPDFDVTHELLERGVEVLVQYPKGEMIELMRGLHDEDE